MALTLLCLAFLCWNPRGIQWRWGRTGEGAPFSILPRVSLVLLCGSIALLGFGLFTAALVLFASLFAFAISSLVDARRWERRRRQGWRGRTGELP